MRTQFRTARPSRARLYELASVQGGYFTAKQARVAGYSKQNVAHHVASGRFERVARGFYRLREFPAVSHDDVIAAWARVGPSRAIVSNETALALYELSTVRPRKIDLTVARKDRPRHRISLATVAIHTTTRPFRPGEIMQRFGVRVTAPARTIVDAAEAGTEPDYIVEAVNRALARGLLTKRELRAAAHDRPERVRRLIDKATAEVQRGTPVH